MTHEREPDPLHEQLRTARDLLRCETVEQCRDAVIALVRRLGGDVGDPDEAGRSATAIDVSFGVGEPLIVLAPSRSEERRVLERVLAQTLEDARVTVDRIRSLSQVRVDAVSDPLTGLRNRRAFGRLLGRLGPGDCLAVVDLDRFKEVNDRHGHAAGDRLLRAFAETLRTSLRLTDHAARLGGDEFAIIFTETPPEEAGRVLERLTGTWEETRPLDVGFSAGIAAVAEEGSARAALDEADQALYRSKGGRDRITIAREMVQEPADGW